MGVIGLEGVVGFFVGFGMKNLCGQRGYMYGLVQVLVCRSLEVRNWVALVCRSRGVSI